MRTELTESEWQERPGVQFKIYINGLHVKTVLRQKLKSHSLPEDADFLLEQQQTLLPQHK